MLKDILSISGKPGLYKLISQGKNMFIAESLVDGKRIPVYARDKVVSLGDIAIYTDEEDKPLADVFEAIRKQENGAQKEIASTITNDELRAYFKMILPDYDRERVYPSDMKKVINWYNLLLKAGYENFEEKESEVVEETKTAGDE